MVELGQSELRGVIEAAAQIGEAADLAQLGPTAVETFGSLVRADVTSYNEVGGGRAPIVIASSGDPTPAEAEVLGRLIHQNPILAHFAATGDGRASRISDFIGDRELRGLPLHRELYRGIGVNFQAAITTTAADGMVIGVALSRGHRDFEPAEVASLELLRPHLISAHRRLTEISWLEQMLAALDAGDGAKAVLLAEPDGRVLRANPAACALLGDDEAFLPAALRSPPGRRRSRPRVVTFEHRGITVRARISPADDSGRWVVVLSPSPMQSVRLAALARGLSSRESEVIACLAGGEAGPDLARRLGISPRTIEKHLGNAYRKLGAGGRPEALAMILTGRPPGATPTTSTASGPHPRRTPEDWGDGR